jgi:hypothetical protein
LLLFNSIQNWLRFRFEQFDKWSRDDDSTSQFNTFESEDIEHRFFVFQIFIIRFIFFLFVFFIFFFLFNSFVFFVFSFFFIFSSFVSLNENSLFMNENSSTISSQNWDFIVFFYSSLNNLAQEECNVCNEIKLAMMLKSWNSSMKCHRCWANKQKNFIMISLFEEINHMNSFLISFHLSRLLIAKKLFIVWAYVFMNFRRVKDC